MCASPATTSTTGWKKTRGRSWNGAITSKASFRSPRFFEDESVQKWNTGCRRLKAVVDEPVPECPACGEKPVVQTDSESDIPQLVCSCNELLSNDGITNVYKRKREWIRRCNALKRKQDNVSEMEQLIGETQ
jgi:hypothetical protein